MSRLAWAAVRVPPEDAPVEDRAYPVYDPPLVVPRTRSLPADARALAELPDRRLYRSLSRAGVLLAGLGLAAREAVEPLLAADRYSVGVYCALDAGPQNYEGAREMAALPPEGFAAAFKRLNHPKRYLAQLVNLPAAQLGILLDLRGPVNVYPHSTAAAGHALEQAEVDLADGRVAAALVVAAFTLEDPLLALRWRAACPPPRVLAEGAAALLLVPGGPLRDPWPPPGEGSRATAGGGSREAGGGGSREAGGPCYGSAHLLIDIARKEGLEWPVKRSCSST